MKVKVNGEWVDVPAFVVEGQGGGTAEGLQMSLKTWSQFYPINCVGDVIGIGELTLRPNFDLSAKLSEGYSLRLFRKIKNKSGRKWTEFLNFDIITRIYCDNDNVVCFEDNSNNTYKTALDFAENVLGYEYDFKQEYCSHKLKNGKTKKYKEGNWVSLPKTISVHLALALVKQATSENDVFIGMAKSDTAAWVEFDLVSQFGRNAMSGTVTTEAPHLHVYWRVK